MNLPDKYEITEADIDAMVRYLKINDPENATSEVAIKTLEDLQAGFHELAHSNPKLLEKWYKELDNQTKTL